MQTLVFATSNHHKLEELKALFPNQAVLGLADIGIYEDIAETGDSLEANALIKAAYLHQKSGQIALSEDTGLEVDALGGAPGVHTARYAGAEKDPDKNMAKLLDALSDKDDRSAQFRTVIAWVDEQETHYFEGIVRGTIAQEKSGNLGFGYDPIFIPDGYDKCFAELDASIKNTISHRARAVDKLRTFLLNREA